MSAEEQGQSRAAGELHWHPSPDERFDPAVRIVDYDPAWPGLVKEKLRRPIVDLQLSVDAIEPRERYVEPLEELGYLFVPAPESPDYHFFAKPPERPRTDHLHACEAGSEQGKRGYVTELEDRAVTWARGVRSRSRRAAGGRTVSGSSATRGA
jgi:hypothetical protein